ncbi:MAG: hypothetical protein ACRDXE_08165 [Acidimicrobiales bacterium]
MIDEVLASVHDDETIRCYVGPDGDANISIGTDLSIGVVGASDTRGQLNVLADLFRSGSEAISAQLAHLERDPRG